MNSQVQIHPSSVSDRWLSGGGKIVGGIALLLTALIIVFGWLIRDEGILSAESGLGYGLGIIGCSLMLLLLTYSLRKRLSLLRRFLPVKFWFRLHMAFGIVGPLCILYHSNFHLGSLNSTVALVCMLLVAGSGIVGRYFYNRIHFGLYGEKIKLQQALEDFKVLKSEISQLVVNAKQQQFCDKLFHAVEELVSAHRASSSMLGFVRARRKARHIEQALSKFIVNLQQRKNSQEQSLAASTTSLAVVNRDIGDSYAVLVAILHKLPGLQLFEKLFSLWHVVHIPIFILMIITAVTHVVVVHMY